MEKKDRIILRRGQVEALLTLTSLKDVKEILSAMVSYGMDGVEPNIKEHLLFGWISIKNSIDYDNVQYNDVVEKRRNAANKRWGKRASQDNANDANDANASGALQDNANDAHNHDHNHNHKNKNSLSPACAWVREYADEILSIANVYPRAKVGDFAELKRLIISAIERETDKPGMDVPKAVVKVKDGVTAYAAAMTGKSKMFIAKPEDFFGKGQYNFDPEVWKMEESTPAGKTTQRKYNPADPTTWKPRTNNNEG
jgi:hypothetical protein